MPRSSFIALSSVYEYPRPNMRTIWIGIEGFEETGKETQLLVKMASLCICYHVQ